MGVINVTPDSFSDAGETYAADAAIARGRQQLEEGADILDVGGESTRPGAASVDPSEEARRIIPIVRALSDAGAVAFVPGAWLRTAARKPGRTGPLTSFTVSRT